MANDPSSDVVIISPINLVLAAAAIALGVPEDKLDRWENMLYYKPLPSSVWAAHRLLRDTAIQLSYPEVNDA